MVAVLCLSQRLLVMHRRRHLLEAVSIIIYSVYMSLPVFWNYLDLRLAAPFSWRIDIVLSADVLTVKIVRLGEAAAVARLQPVVVHPVRATQTVMPGSCDCCGQIACHLNIEAAHPQRPPERSAYLLDIAWPEFRAWIEGRDRSAATLLQTYDGMPSGRSNYAWPTAGWARARSHAWIARARALVRISSAVGMPTRPHQAGS